VTHEPLAVIGIGPDGRATLSPEALDHIRRARVLAGGKRHLGYFADFLGERILIDADLDRAISQIGEGYRRHKTVVLASGDPLFYGIGRRLLADLPKEDLLFLPQVSSIQLAFARLKETWHDACVVSVHGRPIDRLLPALAQHQAKIAILTDNKNNPAAIGEFLEEHGHNEYDMWVCENLGGAEERVRRWTRDTHTSDLNVVVLLRNARAEEPSQVPLLGIPEQELRHRPAKDGCSSEGLITRREHRLLALAYLELHAGDVLWDIGAGSGSVGIEAARLCPQLDVFSVEKEPRALQDVKDNIAKFGLLNVHLIAGEAPDMLVDLPAPNAVFIGGSGGHLDGILASVVDRLGAAGRIVLNCVTIETVSRAWTWLAEHGLSPQVTSVQLAHSRPLGNSHCFEPEKPLFILQARKP
jgi:precorrin-6B C5,15-methyltransferase / cobalt-precorrin-6B C5,C15-methyltransferase